VQTLLGNWVFVLGFLVVGLAIPFAIELYEIFVKEDTEGAKVAPHLMPMVSIFVLAGGFLLRYYVLSGGYHQFPW
jgi:formate-dependent nitrite reductase membrane component NrfD